METWKAIIAAVLLAVPVSAAHAGSRDLLATANQTGKFFELLEAAEIAGVTSTLKGLGPYTVFAPTDEAFEKLDETFIEYIVQPENKNELAAILMGHIVPGKLLAADLNSATEPLSTLLDGRLHVDATDGLRIANARVTATDILASNGVIHAIDTVIEPRF